MTKFTKRQPTAALGYVREADALLTTGQLATVIADGAMRRVEFSLSAHDQFLKLRFSAEQARAIAAELLASAAMLDDQEVNHD